MILVKIKKAITLYNIKIDELFKKVNSEFLIIKYDSSGDAFLDESEFTKMMKIIDSSLNKEELEWLFLIFDVNRDGNISYNEFNNILQKVSLSDST